MYTSQLSCNFEFMSCFNCCIGVWYVTNKSPSIPLVADDSGNGQDDEEEEWEEEEEESCEMKRMASHSRESRFGMEWRWTTTL